jgi:hypothetical protein
VAIYQTYTSVIEISKKMYNDKIFTFPPTESSLCSYCEYQSSCPLFKRNYIVANPSSTGEIEGASSDEQAIFPVIDTYADVSKQISAHKKQLEQNKKLIIDYMQMKGLRELTVEDITLKLSSRKGIDLPDVQALEAFLREKKLRHQASSITRFKLASLLADKVVKAEEL